MIPIAETFHSVQGEGYWVGTPMHFVRLAGCPVGAAASKGLSNPLKPYSGDSDINVHTPLPILSNGLVGSKCRTWDGRYFDCDTDFSCHTHKSVYEILGETWEKHICLTGGEPLIHQRMLVEQGLFAEARAKGIQLHIETSGTVPLYLDSGRCELWIAVAPKWGYTKEMIEMADEIKFLVDDNFSMSRVDEVMQWVMEPCHIFLSPINEEKLVSQKHVDKAMSFLQQQPTWRLSAQWHKFLGVR